MKKTLFVLMIILASCAKDEPKIGLEADIIGTWQSEQTFINGSWLDIPNDMKLKSEFTKDGKYIWSIGDFSEVTGTYSVSGKTSTCEAYGEIIYEVISISGSLAEFKIYMSGEMLHYKAIKLY